VGGTIRSSTAAGGSRQLNAALDNQGTLTVEQTLTMNRSSSAVSNSGTITLTSGDLTINSSPSFRTTGSIDIGSGRTFSIFSVGGGGVFNQQAGSIAGAGTLFLSHLTANFTTPFSNAVTNLALETSTLNGPGTLTVVAGRTLRMTSSTVSAPLVLEGTIAAFGGCHLSGSIGSFTTAVGSKLHLEGDSMIVENGFTNLGTIELTAGNRFLQVNSGTLVNAPSGVIDVQLGTVPLRFLNAQLDNRGTFNLGTALRMTSNGQGSGLVHSNSGAINIANGDLLIDFASSFTNSGTINISTGRTFTVASGVFNQQAGTFSGAGTLFLANVTANFTTDFNNNLSGLSLSDSTLNGPGTLFVKPPQTLQMSRSTVSAPLTLEGTLTVLGDCTLSGSAGSFTTAVGSKIHAGGDGGLFTTNSSLRVANGFTNFGTIELTDNGASGMASLTVVSGTLTTLLLGAIVGVLS
jgi:hypothetical protein